jgi:hypothetical protein
VQTALSDTLGELAQDIKVVYLLQAKGRDEIKGSRVMHAL